MTVVTATLIGLGSERAVPPSRDARTHVTQARETPDGLSPPVPAAPRCDNG